MVAEKVVKFGGVVFQNNVDPEEINKFVRELPQEKKDSIFEVIKELDAQGLITVDPTLDQEDDPC